MNNLKIALLPLDIAWGDCDENLVAVGQTLSLLRPDTDILVLPELFSTGFVDNEITLRELARRHGNTTLTFLRRWSAQYNVAIAGSYLATDDEGNIFNRAFFVEPSGETTFYDKHHLFCLSPESRMFSKGMTLPPVIRFRGWNVSIIVCYDLRFPVWCRNAGQRYDIMLVPANWPQKRSYAWQSLLIARAIENQAVWVGANRSGSDDFGCYDNQSYVYGPMGEPLIPPAGQSAAGNNKQSVATPFIYISYCKTDLQKVRKSLPVASDADPFALL